MILTWIHLFLSLSLYIIFIHVTWMFDLTSFLLLFFYIFFVIVNVMFNLYSFLSLLLCTLIHVKVMLDINLVYKVGFDNLITFATYTKWKIHSLFQLQCKLEKEYLIMIVVVVSSILSYYNVIWDNVHNPFLKGKVFIMVIRCAFQKFFQSQVTTLHMILVALSCAFCVYFIFIIVCVSLFEFCWTIGSHLGYNYNVVVHKCIWKLFK
jgi:hypothetical protein